MSQPAYADDLVAPTLALIEARDLGYARHDESVFERLSFALEPGEVLVVEGGNGSGKTTLIRLLAGLVAPSEGSFRIVGCEGGNQPNGAVAVLGHLLALKGDLTALENLRFRIGLCGLRAGAGPAAALASVGLAGYEDIPVRRLSAGQRKRVALAALLLSPATLWLLDEPYANLDRNGQVLVDRMLEAHCLRGGAALVTSHGLIQPQVARVRCLSLQADAA